MNFQIQHLGKPVGRWALLVACGLLAHCGGGTTTGAVAERKIAMPANSRLTPFTSDQLLLSVSPALVVGETVVCQVGTVPAAACVPDGSRLSFAYAGLAPGEHQLKVTVHTGGVARTHEFQIEIVVPDVLVLGATPAGIAAALAASRQGLKVVMVEPTNGLGGILAGGLAKTDIGRVGGSYIGGISHDFFAQARAWSQNQGGCTNPAVCPEFYDLEPKAAQATFDAMLAVENRVGILRGLAVTAVRKSGAQIAAVVTPRGVIGAKVFIDASYEGDLMALAGVGFTVGREARLNALPGDPNYAHVEDDSGIGSFTPPYGVAVDPYVIPGDPASGLLPFVEPRPAKFAPAGSADHRVMAYNFRVCVTDDPGNRVPFTPPAGFDAGQHEGSARIAQALQAAKGTPLDTVYFNPAKTVGSKTPGYFKYDLNGGSVFSTDMTAPGLNHDYAAASPAVRAQIVRRYQTYTQGALYTWQTDARFGALNAKVARFGLCADEFTDNGNWPTALYIRETRRMLGDYVMNANDVLANGRRPPIADAIGMGGYNMDSHIRQITVANRSVGGAPARDVVVSEGFNTIHLSSSASTDRAYRIAYGSLLPKRHEAINLLNPVTLSSTALAYSSLRMEPTFMILGQAAGTAAAMAVSGGQSVHDIDRSALQRKLKENGQVID